jgi:Uma2 family endonuclease
MAVQIPERVITQEDLLALDAQDKWIEVVDGEIVADENNVTYLHVIIIDNLFRLLDVFVRANGLGRVQTDGLRFILIGTRKKIRLARKPDFSFIRAGRIPQNYDWSGDFEGAPDFAVEVASPGQTNTILTRKIADYLSAGTEEAWLMYPQRGEIYQYRHDAEVPRLYKLGDSIETPLFPKLQIIVNDIFATE